ncbi:MAG: hypothetical protein OXC81_07945 [Betaproteobacteria bacterium]|nr:hypothetical protein [Betaproteobacteria bacterium]
MPSVNGSGAPPAAANGTGPDDVKVNQPAGSFNQQQVAIVASQGDDAGISAPDPNQIKDWKQNRSEQKPTAATSQLKDAAESARSQGLLERLRSAVRAVINFFTRNLGSTPPPPSQASLQSLVNQQRLDGLAQARTKIATATKNLENPKIGTLAAINQAAKNIRLPDAAAVKTLTLPSNVQNIIGDSGATAGKHPELTERFQEAANLLDKVYETRLNMNGLQAKPSFAELFKAAGEGNGLTKMKNLSQQQDRALRTWIVNALNLVDNCAQVMADAAAGRKSDPNLALGTLLANDIKESAIKQPAIKLGDEPPELTEGKFTEFRDEWQ